MRENKLTIKINRPLQEVWEFTLDAKNTPKWMEDCLKEEASPWPAAPGTVYTHTNKDGAIFKFTMTGISPMDHFDMLGEDNNYHCRYTYKDLGDGTTELEYYEWMEKGELDGPVPQEVLQKLKSVMEA